MRVDDRIRVERPRPEHAEGLLALLNEPIVATWLGGVRDTDAVQRMIAEDEARWRDFGYGMLLAVDEQRGGVLGRSAVRQTTLEGREAVELLYTVRPDLWGRSLATNLSWRALKFFFDAQPGGVVTAFTLPENSASVRVMTKLGFQYERDVVHAGLRHVLYIGTAEVMAAAPDDVFDHMAD